ncbi:hypothetical protein GCM10009798_10460 [Nocardioides panacihumi]|uniref:Uncharacterized protein n=1 Tax=Nocardioides panacihumi TaxID=400774 RepID=A0ABN2QJL0_9ACTN
MRRDHRCAPLVRPRLVWSGLVLALGGAVAIAVGLIIASVAAWVAGIAVLVLGGVVAVRGGILRDATPAASFGAELEHLRTGDPRPGTSPGAMVRSPAARADSVATAERVRRVRARSVVTSAGPYDRPAGWTILIGVLVLVWTQWGISAEGTTTMRADSFRAVAAAIVLGLAGIRCVAGAGVHRVAGWVAALAGELLVLQGVFAPHQLLGRSVVEVMVGAVAVLAGVVVGVSSSAVESSVGSRRGEE